MATNPIADLAQEVAQLVETNATLVETAQNAIGQTSEYADAAAASAAEAAATLVSAVKKADLEAEATQPAYDYSAVEAQSIFDNSLPKQNYTELRAYNEVRAKSIRITGLYTSLTADGISGYFKINPTDTTSADNGGTIIVDALGRRWYRQFTGNVRAAWFGVDHTGTNDSTSAIQAAIDFMYATRSGLSAGLGVLSFDRGVVLVNGDVLLGVARGLTIKGEGFGSTEIRRTIDTGTLFAPTIYSYLSFEDLSINHTGVVADRAGWTNTCIDLSGINNIGQDFFLKRVRIGGFSKQINFGTRSLNGDTNFISDCLFADFDIFLEAANNQGIINRFSNCTWQGTGRSVFKTSGFGHTHFDTCNILIGGVWLDLTGSGGPQSIYIMDNCKFEFWPQAASVGTTRLVAMANAMNVKILFRGGGIAGSSPDPTVFQIENRCSSGGIEFDGGNWASNVKIKHYKQVLTSVYGATAFSVCTKFKNCTISPSPANIIFDATGGTNQSYPGAIWENCQDRTNLCVTGIANGQTYNSTVPADSLINRATFTGASVSGALLNGTTAVTYPMPHYGQPAFLRAVRVLVHSQAVVVSGTIKVFADAAKTIQIGSTIAMTGGASTTPKIYDFTVPADTVVTEGVYVEMNNTNGVYAYGRVYIETMSI